MGDKIPLKSLMPNRIRVQTKIVTYHNYFRTKVIPRASNMLKMVRSKYVILVMNTKKRERIPYWMIEFESVILMMHFF